MLDSKAWSSPEALTVATERLTLKGGDGKVYKAMIAVKAAGTLAPGE